MTSNVFKLIIQIYLDFSDILEPIIKIYYDFSDFSCKEIYTDGYTPARAKQGYMTQYVLLFAHNWEEEEEYTIHKGINTQVNIMT